MNHRNNTRDRHDAIIHRTRTRSMTNTIRSENPTTAPKVCVHGSLSTCVFDKFQREVERPLEATLFYNSTPVCLVSMRTHARLRARSLARLLACSPERARVPSAHRDRRIPAGNPRRRSTQSTRCVQCKALKRYVIEFDKRPDTRHSEPPFRARRRNIKQRDR